MKSNGIWMLIAGLAVGFVVGREVNRGSSTSSGGGETARTETTPTAGKAPGAAPAGTIDPSWLTESDLGVGESMKGLTTSQRFQVLKFYNETPCDCGCPHGSFAKCKKEDPGCPRAPKVLDEAVALAKQGKSYTEIAAATKKPSGGAQPQAAPPSPNQKVELAKWSPIEGPRLAKVTIVEFSDFQ